MKSRFDWKTGKAKPVAETAHWGHIETRVERGTPPLGFPRGVAAVCVWVRRVKRRFANETKHDTGYGRRTVEGNFRSTHQSGRFCVITVHITSN